MYLRRWRRTFDDVIIVVCAHCDVGADIISMCAGLTEKAHVLLEKGEPYTAVLNMVDIARGTNSYYKLQILESDKSNK